MNTEVKLQHAKSSWGIAPCEDRTLPRELESCPSWPKEQHWKCCIRVKACIKGSNPLLSVYDPLVKWLRHHPFTVVSWVRIPYGSLGTPADNAVMEHWWADFKSIWLEHRPKGANSSRVTGTGSCWNNVLRVSRMLCKKGNFARVNWQF